MDLTLRRLENLKSDISVAGFRLDWSYASDVHCMLIILVNSKQGSSAQVIRALLFNRLNSCNAFAHVFTNLP
jgi:hypothetical protein